MTQPPYPYGQPSQDPWAQQSGSGYGQYGQPGPREQPQRQPGYGGQWDQTERFGPSQQQYGQYGQTQQFGAPYGGGQYGGFPPEPPRKKTGMVVAIVVVAVLVLAGAGVGIYFATKGDSGDDVAGGSTTTTTTATDTSDTSSSDEETTTEDQETGTGSSGGAAIDAQPGDCIKVNVADEKNADIETVECSSPDAIYEVGTREETSTETCPNEQYVQYTEEGRLLLCLELHVAEGDCLQVTDQQDKRADCTAPEATHRVVGVFDGVDDETRCGDESTEALTYPQPPLTICLVSPAS